MKKKQTIYAVLYTHRFGENLYVIRSNHAPTQDEIIKACEIDDFEPDREESIEWDEVEIIQL